MSSFHPLYQFLLYDAAVILGGFITLLIRPVQHYACLMVVVVSVQKWSAVEKHHHLLLFLPLRKVCVYIHALAWAGVYLHV